MSCGVQEKASLYTSPFNPPPEGDKKIAPGESRGQASGMVNMKNTGFPLSREWRTGDVE